MNSIEKEKDKMIPNESKNMELYTKLKNPFLLEKILSKERILHLKREFELKILDNQLTELEVKLIETYLESSDLVLPDKNEDSEQYFLVSLLKHYEDENDANINFRLGYCYDNGIGIAKDKKKAVQFYERSSNAGALNNLAVCYEFGDGVEINKQKSFEYYTKSYQKQKNQDNTFNLAMSYKEGTGIPKNANMAFKLFLEVYQIDDKYMLVINELIECYKFGLGTEKDEQKAKELEKLLLENK